MTTLIVIGVEQKTHYIKNEITRKTGTNGN